MKSINNRNNLIQLIRENSIGCELGVFEGDFSQILLDSGRFDKLFLVDVFSGESSNFGKIYKDSSILENYIKSKFVHNKTIEVVKSDSVEFLRSLPDNYLDFIYIDTIHDYDHTKKELIESYRVIKNLGLICGHDYTDKYFPGTVLAVNEFCQSYKQQLSVTTDQEPYPSFFIEIIK